jgi:Polysaccharide pyruvyl transferase
MACVGLVGWYWRGNFGDDLMAAQYITRLQRAGHRVKVWNLSNAVDMASASCMCATIDELMEGVDVVVYGGGGLFTDAHAKMEPHGDFGASMLKLTELIKKNGVPLILSSVGGDGRPPTLTVPQKALLELASFLTLRLNSDRFWVKEINSNFLVFPDVVWRARIDLDVAVTESAANNKKVLLSHSPPWWELLAIRCALLLRKRTRKFKVVQVVTEQPGWAVCDSSILQYSGLARFVAEMSSVDSVFSSRLHLPIFALSFGAGYLGYKREPKAECAFHEACIPTKSVGDSIGERRFGSVLRCIGLVRAVLFGQFAHGEANSLEKLAQDANGHFEILLRKIDGLSLGGKFESHPSK